MEDADFPDDFCRFIQRSIPSVEAAEILLLLRKSPERSWTTAEIVEALRGSITLQEADAARMIEGLQSRGLLALDADRRARYRTSSAELEQYSQRLALAYVQRPVTLIRMIYALRDTRIQSFADAFKIRKN